MDLPNDPNSSNPVLFSDPFSATSFPLSTSNVNTPLVNPTITNTNSNNQFALASPSPSTPGRGFNPDDFLVSPPQLSSQATPIESHGATPELKRRLFGPSDVGQHAQAIVTGSTPRHNMNTPSRLQSSLRFSSPPDRVPSPLISFSFSPQESFLPDALPANGSASRSTPMPALSTGIDHSLLDPLPSPPQCGTELPRNNVGHQQSSPSPITSVPPFSFAQTGNFHTRGQTQTPTPSDMPIDCPTGDTVEPQPKLDKVEDRIEKQILSQRRGEPDNTGAILLKPSDPTLSHLPTTPFTPDSGSEKFKCCCKASKCLKLYCICFAKSGYCSEGCSCKNCLNTRETPNAVREARDTVLARDPRAFDPKVRLSVRSTAGTPAASDIHAKGCNCRKGCSKKYCVCRELRVECGPRCTCSGPKGCLNRRITTRSERLSLLTPAGSSASTGQGQVSPLKIPLHTPSSHQAVGVPNIELPPSGYTSIIADQLKGQRGKNKGKIRARIRKRDREQVIERGSTKGTNLKRQKHELTSDEDASMGLGALFENTLNGLDGREGPVQELDAVGLDIDKSPTVGLNDDVEKFREVTDGLIADVGFVRTAANVGSQVVEQVLAKVGENSPILDIESIGQTKAEKTPTQCPIDNGDDINNTKLRSRGKKKERNSEGRRENGFSVFGRESDGIDMCRIPRIFRVKMGSGRLLNKFGL